MKNIHLNIHDDLHQYGLYTGYDYIFDAGDVLPILKEKVNGI